MKRLFLSTILVVLVVVALPSFATERYFSVSSGTWLPQKTSTVDINLKPITSSYSPGWSLGGTYGVSFDSGFRLENELVYRQADAQKSSSDQWNLAWMINLWWDARNSTPITPYFGGGFGFGRGKVASPGIIDESGLGIAYQAGGGIAYNLSAGLDLDFGYRYFGIADTSNKGAIGDFNPTGSSWTVGLRKRF